MLEAGEIAASIIRGPRERRVTWLAVPKVLTLCQDLHATGLQSM
jgi:hypothetical protein